MTPKAVATDAPALKSGFPPSGSENPREEAHRDEGRQQVDVPGGDAKKGAHNCAAAHICI